ncbi:hypothetical protein EV426DRAFT_46656 [Tirmania nivea]|nr:hypothetical protein EV426DRAFT_46656 [Tirmania nivea]
MMLFPGAMAPTYLIPAPVAVFCPAPAPEKKEEKKEEKKPDPPKPDPPKPDPPKPDPPKPQCKPKCDHSHLLQHGPHIQINYGHCVHALSTCGSGCGGCSLVCCGPGPPCKAPRNTSTELMHWLDKKNAVHSVKKGELIPHYSKIAQVYTNKKWEVFTAASDMKAAQDACSCVQAVRFFFPFPLRDCIGSSFTLRPTRLPSPLF